MSEFPAFSVTRRKALGGVAVTSFAIQMPARAAANQCLEQDAPAGESVYEFDIAGKPIEWDFPDGNPVPGGLSLKGLGLQKTPSKKNTNDPGLADIANLASRFLNKSTIDDWHPATLWSLQFAAKGVIALERDEDKVGATSIADDYFAFQRVGGVNPSMLKRVSSDPDFGPLMNGGQSYFMVDYQSLETLQDNDHVSDDERHGPNDLLRYNYQPKALFTGVDGALQPVAILIRRGSDTALVKPGEESWEIAKFILQSADMNYHQLATHLGGTHLYIEPFAIAAGMHLPKDAHPISRLMRPHFEGMLNINDFATTDLINVCPEVAKGGVFDLNFSGTMASNVQFITEEVFGFYSPAQLQRQAGLAQRVANLFNEKMFAYDIVRRGVGHVREVPFDAEAASDTRGAEAIRILLTAPGPAAGSGLGFVYPYLEDSCKLWNAITRWVGSYVGHFYPSDAAVQADCALQAWAQTIATDGKIYGFGEYRDGSTQAGVIETRSYLVKALTAIIFNASVQHAAVNFTQADFGPTLPAGIYHDYFTGNSREVTDYLPNAAHFREVMDTLSILAASQYTTLGKYHENDSNAKRMRSILRYFPAKEIREAAKDFRSELEGIEAEIEERETTAKFGYGYLRPSKIPQSINV